MHKTKIVLIAVVAIVLGGVFVYFFSLIQEKSETSEKGKNVPALPVQTLPLTEDSKNKTDERGTYNNEKANFSIRYPKKWGSVKAEVFREAISEIGEEFYVLFSKDASLGNFSLAGHTENYVPWEGWRPGDHYKGTDPLLYCKEIEKRIVFLDSCQSIDANKAVITFGYYDDMGGLFLTREAFVRNPGNKYSGVIITYRFDNEGVDSGMGNMNEGQVREVIEGQLKKIDRETVMIFDEAVSSFSSMKPAN